MSLSLNILFAGTNILSVQYLISLINSTHNVVAVFTKKDQNSKNKKRELISIEKISKQNNIPILQPLRLDNEIYYSLIKLKIDIIIVVSYGLIFPKKILNIPKFGCINVHFSLLPRWRGPAPVQRAILAGDEKTGITIIKMNEKIDAGDILYQEEYLIKKNDTNYSLSEKLSKIGLQALLITLENIIFGKIKYIKQKNFFSTYAPKISKKESRINWNFTAIQLERCVRAFNPWPTSYFIFLNKRIKVWDAISKTDNKIRLQIPGTFLYKNKIGIHIATGNGILIIIQLQPEGKKKMLAKDFLNSRSNQFFPGVILE